MSWGKIDDKLHSHPKAEGAGLEAMGLWAMALSYCAAYLTDGYVSRERAKRIAGDRSEALAARLVAAELWEAIPGGAGWLFHDWADYQPTRAAVEAERAKKSKAGKASGEARGNRSTNRTRTPVQQEHEQNANTCSTGARTEREHHSDGGAQSRASEDGAPTSGEARESLGNLQVPAQERDVLRAPERARPVPSRPLEDPPLPPKGGDGSPAAPGDGAAPFALASPDPDRGRARQKPAAGAKRPTVDHAHQRYAAAYAAGMTDATGQPFTPPTDSHAQHVFRTVLPAHARDPSGAPLTGNDLLAWIRASAAEWRRSVKPEGAKFTPGFKPMHWQAWLDAGRPGAAPPPRVARAEELDVEAEVERRRRAPVEDE